MANEEWKNNELSKIKIEIPKQTWVTLRKPWHLPTGGLTDGRTAGGGLRVGWQVDGWTDGQSGQGYNKTSLCYINILQ